MPGLEGLRHRGVLTIDSATRADAPYLAGADPWVLIVGVGAAIASAAVSSVFISAGVAGAAVAA